jgi:mannose-1-phosphate guanylyltransferase
VSIMELETAIQYHSVGNAELTAGEFVDSTPVPRMSAAGAGCAEPGKRWGIVPAGGDGRRLLGLTRLVTGDDRPKQFCSLFGGESLLEQTRRRAERSIPGERILYPLSRAHRAFYLREPGIRPSQRIVQPTNKGTAPPIVYSLLSIERLDSDGIVAVLPSDHHYSDEAAFTAALESAFETARRHNDSVVVLGSPAGDAESEYGWIETGPALDDGDSSSFRVDGFFEKPSLELARRLYERGALWNTFVMVGHVRAFLNMVRAARYGLARTYFGALWASGEVYIPDWLYERIPAADFSREILSIQPQRLIVQRLSHLVWNDLGHPERVMDVLDTNGLKPWWMKEWRTLRRPPGVEASRTEARVAEAPRTKAKVA